MESQNVEFKQTWKDEYLKWVCGFANAQGGIIYIGIDDNGKVCGVKGVDKLMEDIPNKIIMSMGFVADVSLLQQDGKDYLAISVMQCGNPISFKGKYYYRTGSTLQELNGTALQDFILRKMNTSWDATIQANATMDDIDRSAIDSFLHSAIRSKRLSESVLNDSTDKILRNLKLINDQNQLTIAALLLFGKDIEKWSMSAGFKIGRFGINQADLIIQDKIVCPLIMMPSKVISTLRTNYLVSPIRYEGLQRVEDLEIPEDALREMVCNAIVHRDYLGTFIHMRIWDNRVELWNPGTLPSNLSVETLLEAHESQPRNKLIANAFYLAGFIESWGRGYEKIQADFEAEKLQIPIFEQVRGGFMATIKRERFIEIGNKKHVEDSTQKCSQKSSQKSSQKILDLMRNNPNITLVELALSLNMTRRSIDKKIKILKEQEKIRRVGPDRGGHWEVL